MGGVREREHLHLQTATVSLPEARQRGKAVSRLPGRVVVTFEARCRRADGVMCGSAGLVPGSFSICNLTCRNFILVSSCRLYGIVLAVTVRGSAFERLGTAWMHRCSHT